MIFAICDFLKYWLHKGIYSDDGLKKEGAIIASEEILSALEQIKFAFIFVHTRNNFLSWLVMYYTGPTVWSHCATMVEGGILYDMTTEGGIKHHISDYFDEKTYIKVIPIPTRTENIRKMIIFSERAVLGGKFAWGKIFRFWLAIITGTDIEYRLRYTLDITIVLLFLFILSHSIFAIQVFIAAVFFIYISILLFNKLYRKVPNKFDVDIETSVR